MGQFFRLVDLDARLADELGRLGDSIWHISLHRNLLYGDIVEYLKPLEEFRHDCFPSRQGKKVGLGPLHGQKQSPLLKILPLDVLRLIFDYFGQPNGRDMTGGVDAASFALTCQLLFEVGYPVLKRHQAATQKTWVGHRLILAGEDQRGDDLPPGLDVPPSWKLREKNIYTETASWPSVYRDLKEAVNETPTDLIPIGNGVFERMFASGDAEEVDAALRLQDLWTNHMFGFDRLPPLEIPVLRNLTTKEYARGDTLRRAQRRKSSRLIEHLGVGDLAVFRIVWSSDPWSSVAADSFVRGPWAGHRFDIVDIALVDLDGWEDVSEKLIKEVAQIYSSNRS